MRVRPFAISKRTASFTLLLCLACGQRSEAKTSRPAAPSPPSASLANEPKPAPAQVPSSTTLDAAKAKAFVAYQEKLIPIVATAKTEAERKQVGPSFEAARKQFGLTPDDTKGLTEIMVGVVTRRNLAELRQSYGDAVVDAMMLERETFLRQFGQLATSSSNP